MPSLAEMPSRPLRIAILECGAAPRSTRQKYGGFEGVFSALLHVAGSSLPGSAGAAPTLSLSTFNIAQTPAAYPALDDIDAVLLSGSAANAFDEDEWIARLVAFVGSVLEQRRVRIVAACFGHQIVARALGARVGRSERGWEAGVTPMEVTGIGREVFGKESLTRKEATCREKSGEGTAHVLREDLGYMLSNAAQALYQSHQDEVYECPPGVERLAFTDVCPVQAMYIPKRVMTVQGHPEFTEEIMRAVLEKKLSKGVFTQEMFDEAVKTVGRDQDGALVARAFLRFLLEE